MAPSGVATAIQNILHLLYNDHTNCIKFRDLFNYLILQTPDDYFIGNPTLLAAIHDYSRQIIEIIDDLPVDAEHLRSRINVYTTKFPLV